MKLILVTIPVLLWFSLVAAEEGKPDCKVYRSGGEVYFRVGGANGSFIRYHVVGGKIEPLVHVNGGAILVGNRVIHTNTPPSAEMVLECKKIFASLKGEFGKLAEKLVRAMEKDPAKFGCEVR